jgi:hypothetical protein
MFQNRSEPPIATLAKISGITTTGNEKLPSN